MNLQTTALTDNYHDPLACVEEVEEASEDVRWFLSGPIEEEPDDLPSGPWAEPHKTDVLRDWRKAEAGNAAGLARVAGQLGALDNRRRHGPEGWRHRLALIEAPVQRISTTAGGNHIAASRGLTP